MKNERYVKEIILSKSYDDVCENIIEVSKAKNFSLVEEDKDFNRYVLSYEGFDIEVNLEKIDANQTKLRVLCKHKGKYFDAQSIVMKTISKFEEALQMSFKGTSSEFDGAGVISAGDNASGCIGILIFIFAIVAVIFGVIGLMS